MISDNIRPPLRLYPMFSKGQRHTDESVMIKYVMAGYGAAKHVAVEYGAAEYTSVNFFFNFEML